MLRMFDIETKINGVKRSVLMKSGNASTDDRYVRSKVTVITSTFKHIEAEWHMYASVTWVNIGSENVLSPMRHTIIIQNYAVLWIGSIRKTFQSVFFKNHTQFPYRK